MLTSADDRHDHETFSLAAIERLDALRDRIRHRGIERRAFSYWGSVKGTVTLDVLRSPFFTLSFGVYASTVLCFAHPAGAEDRALYMTVLTILGAFLSFASSAVSLLCRRLEAPMACRSRRREHHAIAATVALTQVDLPQQGDVHAL